MNDVCSCPGLCTGECRYATALTLDADERAGRVGSIVLADAFDESKHPRASDGKFGKGGGRKIKKSNSEKTKKSSNEKTTKTGSTKANVGSRLNGDLKITKRENATLNEYAFEGDAHQINKHLRNEAHFPEYDESIKTLDSLMKRTSLPAHSSLRVVSDTSYLPKIGKTFVDPGFVSTTIDPKQVKVMKGTAKADGVKSSEMAVFEIKIPRTARGVYVPDTGTLPDKEEFYVSHEVLLARGCEFKVVGESNGKKYGVGKVYQLELVKQGAKAKGKPKADVQEAFQMPPENASRQENVTAFNELHRLRQAAPYPSDEERNYAQKMKILFTRLYG